MINEMSEERLQPERTKQGKSFRGTIVFVWALIALLLWWALGQAPLGEIIQTLRTLRPWQFAAVVGMNLLIYATISLRWRMVMRGLSQAGPSPSVRFADLFAYRISSFGVNYFTPGPFGGEPLQFFLLTRRSKLENASALSGIFLDRLLEALVTITFVVTGLVLLMLRGMAEAGLNAWAAPAAGLVIALPLAHMLALWRGKLPLSSLLARINGGERWQKVRATVLRAEEQIVALFATRPSVLLAGTALSVLTWLLMLAEFIMMLRFLSIQLGAVESLIALTVAQLAFAVPVPSGLGTLEAGQVFAMQMFAVNPVLGLSLSLLMRARDVLFGIVGLLLAGWLVKG